MRYLIIISLRTKESIIDIYVLNLISMDPTYNRIGRYSISVLLE